MLVDFWKRASGPVHPDDVETLNSQPAHTFELDYPPPAFIGDPDAPVVVLLANGGPSRPGEFDDEGKIASFYAALRGEPFTLSDVHGSNRVQRWVAAGLAVRVNSVAYRSRSLSVEPVNKALATQLPSVALHRAWLRDHVLPAARRGERYVIVQRLGVWGLDPKVDAGPNVIFSRNPISGSPSNKVLDAAETWLRTRGISLTG